jgi:putative FmdB family regulatory protein
MPIYEYQCKNCGVFEITQRITEDPLKQCPTCHGSELHRLISHTSFVLKGGGWYATDYANKSAPSKSDSKDDASSSADASASNGKNGAESSNGTSSGADTPAKASTDKSSSSKAAE